MNIGYNKNKDEYIGLLEEKNKLIKEFEKSKEHQEKKKIEDREKGFNIYLSGANEERIKEQRKNELFKGRAHSNSDRQQQQQQQEKEYGEILVSKKWKNKSRYKLRNSSSIQLGKLMLQNIIIQQLQFQFIQQFDLNQGKPIKQGGQDQISPAKPRKRWGDISQNTGNQPVRVMHQHKGKQDDDNYSDSFEEGGDEIEQEEKIEEEVKELEQFLRTATLKDINELRTSLSFKDQKEFAAFQKKEKEKSNADKQEEDNDYIEEDFEEDIPEVDEDENDSEEERKQEEEARQRALQAQKVSTTKKTNQQARNRPISATYNLAQAKVQQTQKIEPSQQQQQLSQVGIAPSTVKNQYNVSLNPLTSSNYQSSLGSQSLYKDLIQETPKQPNDIMKKPINTNPFKRPFSQNLPLRSNIQSQQENKEGYATMNKQQQEKGQEQSSFQTMNLLQRISNLELNQKEKLIEILQELEQQSLLQSQTSNKNQKLNIQPEKLELKKVLSPPKEEIKKNIDRARTEIVIRVLNTYGNPHLCGLTEIELFDEKANKIVLMPSWLIVRNLGSGTTYKTEKLINGNKLTNDDKQMWIGYLPKPPQKLEIVIFCPREYQMGGLKIWNYNKSISDYTKGVKDVEILINETVFWSGKINGGKGKNNEDYSTLIPLREGIMLPSEYQEEKLQPTISEAFEDEEESKLDNMGGGNSEGERGKDEDDFKKYKSEAVFKGVSGGGSKPLWLQESSQSSSVKSQQVRFSERELANSQQQQKRNRANQPEYNTADLLGKYQSLSEVKLQDNISTTIPSQERSISSNQSQNQKLSSQSQVNLGQQPLINQQLKPNVGMSNIQSGIQKGYQQSKPFEYQQISSQFKSNTQQQQQQIQQREQLADTQEAIMKAVSKANQVVSQGVQNKGRRIVKIMEPTNSKLVEESLDNLDFFRVTNLGRLVQDGEKKTEGKGLEGSPLKSLQESQLSQSKLRQAHVVVKNPFPEKQQQTNKNQTQRTKQSNLPAGSDMDVLDQFLKQDKKQITQRTSQMQMQSNNLDQLLEEFSGPSKINELKPQANQKQGKQQKQELIIAKDNSATFDQKIKQFQNEMFIIPNLPMGQKLMINLISTWGDMNYVGLTGIEIYDIEGKQIKVDESQISACPPDINILPGYGGDPRTIDKLVDNTYFTQDDLHVWLTPFTAGEDHTISIDFGKREQISMIRIWNYNKSRIHSYRGARLITCQLDNKFIFKGEIQKSPGNLNDPENCCEVLLFTDNEAILSRIDSNDWINDVNFKKVEEVSELLNTQKMKEMPVPSNLFDERPMTATKKFNTEEIYEIQRQLKQQKPTSLFDERPQTSAIIAQEGQGYLSTKEKLEKKQKDIGQLQQIESKKIANQQNKSTSGISGRKIEMNILETWGDLFYVGLNGIEVIDDKGKIISIQVSQIDANPRDMNSIPGYGQDYRTLDKLLNGMNNTMDDHNMWLIPFNKGENHTIVIDFGRVISIQAIRFYNYNKSDEDSLRGVKQIAIQVDQKLVTPKKGITLRKAPGLISSTLDIGQTINLPFRNGWSSDMIIPIQRKFENLGLFQEYEPLNMPMGFIFKFNLYSTHGDFYYIGLNGIELFDQNGMIINCKQIQAVPQGVNSLKGMEGDIRTIDKLINGKNQTYDETNMWLSPFKNTKSQQAAGGKEAASQEARQPNFVLLQFDYPVAISAIRLWNYSKTPSRGVNEFELYVDDKQVYRGYVKQAPQKEEWDKSFNKDFSTVVILTSDQKLVERFKNNIYYSPTKQQSVLMTCDGKVLNKDQMKVRREEKLPNFNDLERPKTMVMRN